MKKIIKTLMFVTLIFVLISGNNNVSASQNKVIYFYSPTCLECIELGKYLDDFEDSSIEIIKYNTTEIEKLNLFHAYNATYFVPKSKQSAPIMFAGDKFFHGKDVIISSLEDNSIQESAFNPLKKVNEDAVNIEIKGFLGTMYMVFSGLLDGFNPCAMAMLLLFISLLGFTSKKSTLIGISSVYITALFITYFALGTLLFQFLHILNLSVVAFFVNWLIISLCSLLFIYNIYDFIVSRNEHYSKIKLQLPKSIQKFNKKIMKFFTKKFSEGSKMLYVFTFLLGVVISLTEFLCTGQIYLPVIISLIQSSESFDATAIIYLLLYNLAFVTPLIVLAVIAIKTKSVMSASNKIREKMHIIKLFNAFLFFIIALFYILRMI